MDSNNTTLNLRFTNHVGRELDSIIDEMKPASVFILVDTNSNNEVLPRLQMLSEEAGKAHVIIIQNGDSNKNIESLSKVWQQLSDNGATRNSLLINVGGGMVTDLGAFAASTFKRGIRFINIPTTLLAAVDASVGGKTGINFNGLKNEVGTFRNADAVIISTIFFNTLSLTELKSGYAEMIKHALLTSSEEYTSLISRQVQDISPDALLQLLEKSVSVKRDIVTQDPTEKGIRRALNLGHTAGHAFEALAMERKSPIPHGYAVAYGMVVSLILSHMKFGLDTNEIHRYATYTRETYGAFAFDCNQYPRLLELMGHDKKNEVAGNVNFTLLKSIGEPVCGNNISTDDITAALDIYRDVMHLA